MKRIVFLLFLLIFSIELLAQTAVLPVGNGTEENPYQIVFWQNLYWISVPGTINGLSQAQRWSKYYIQTANIDLSNAIPAINTWDNGAGWTPIGRDDIVFSGTYNGDNKSITGLFINRHSTNNHGLFGYTYNAMIKNIGLINTCITGCNFTGGLVGYCYIASISNCYCIGSVTGNKDLGWLVGSNNDGTITHSFWDIETLGQLTSAGATGKTTTMMKNISTFTDKGWSFPDVWNIDSELNNGYPYLSCFNSVANDDLVISQTVDSKALINNAYPNPFNPSTTLSFELSSPEIVKIDIYNVKGQLVKSLVKGLYNTGKHSIVWDGKDNNENPSCSGVYFYKMQAGKSNQTKKMMLMK